MFRFKRPKEFGSSSTQEGLTDLPIDAAAWLLHFKTQNTDLLTRFDVRTTKDYVWSKRETTPANSTLLELVDHGINRAKYASDVVSVLLDEIKLQSTKGKIRTMVLIDGYNSLFYEKTNLKGEHKVMIPSSKITLTKPFLELTKHNWSNGLCVLAVDKIAMLGWDRQSHLPIYLLGRKGKELNKKLWKQKFYNNLLYIGFEHLDPFVPIQSDNYDEKEYESCLAYYCNRKWIQNQGDGYDKELKYLSNCNPYKLMELCKSL